MQKIHVRYEMQEKIVESKVNFNNCFKENKNENKNLPLLYINSKNEEFMIGTVSRIDRETFIVTILPIGDEYQDAFVNLEELRFTVSKIEGGRGYLFILKYK